MEASVRIGCASGFWGDSEVGPRQLVDLGDLDYLVFDYLAEITMAILSRAKSKSPDTGYALDFVDETMRRIGKDVAERGIKVVANAGGVNPDACRDALTHVLRELGVQARIALVLGDDLSELSPDALSRCATDLAGKPVDLPEGMTSTNAYLGALPIARALDQGADIVIVGRCVDSALVLGPLMHEFGWAADQYELLASGSLVGHLIECGPMATGGVFTDWTDVPSWETIGYPIADCRADGTATITKPHGTGGRVAVDSVAEQLTYEVQDPGNYQLPDVVCDWTHVQLTQRGPDEVHVSGALGRAPTSSYKVSATFLDGYRATSGLILVGNDASAKAERVADAILSRCRTLLDAEGMPDFTETSCEVVGDDQLHGAAARPSGSREVFFKLAVRHPDARAVRLFTREVAPAITATAPGISGFFGGRPKVVPVHRFCPFFVPKHEVPALVDLDGTRTPVDIPCPEGTVTEPSPAPHGDVQVVEPHAWIPLLDLAHGRSGDKGDTANIGIIARKAEYAPILREYLTADFVARVFARYLDGRVTRFEFPSINGFNFVLENSLGGGGTGSLRIDPQGKTFAPILLDTDLPIPAAVAAAHRLTPVGTSSRRED